MSSSTRILILSLVLCLVAALPVGAQSAPGAPDEEGYTEHDLDNYLRARGRQITEPTDPDYHQDFARACVDSTSRSATRQAVDASHGRIYGSVGHATCWWSVGHAPDYFGVTPQRVHFLARTGAKLQGHLWYPSDSDEAGPRPGVVITTGSIQASEEMYWFAARALAAAGYVVLTYDVQQQGGSEAFGHAPGSPVPTTDGFPGQQEANFVNGTVDAMRFFLSTPENPYTPQGWSDEDVEAARAAASGEPINWVNPGWGVVDRERLGLAGHSLGASATSTVQQCSDEGDRWRELELCGGRSFPIRALVAWDALSSSPTPVVPAMDQRADGYFLFPTLSPTPPDPDSSMGGYTHWRDAGLDTFMFVVRGGTHIEWSQTPYTSATTYGWHAISYYTVAWMDRYVHVDRAVRADGYRRLVEGPTADAEFPWAANYFSARRYSAMTLRPPHLDAAPRDAVSPAVDVVDLRKWAGRSEVGDWVGANADTAGRPVP